MGNNLASVEIELVGGEKLILDKDVYDKLPYKDKWRVYSSNGRTFVGRPRGPKGSILYISTLLFDYDRRRQRIVFKNGNRFDYRKSNMSFPLREGNKEQKNSDVFRKRRDAAPPEIRMNGCVLTKAKAGKRCAAYLHCSHYGKCLDEVCAKTEWPGWAATRT